MGKKRNETLYYRPREDGREEIKIKAPLQRGGNLTQGLWEV